MQFRKESLIMKKFRLRLIIIWFLAAIKQSYRLFKKKMPRKGMKRNFLTNISAVRETP